MADPLLRIDALHAGYGDAVVLHGIDLTIADGAAVALLGRNGAGKSTVLKTILNAGPKLVSGRISLDGRDLRTLGADARARAGLMLVPEDRRIFPTSPWPRTSPLASMPPARGEADDHGRDLGSVPRPGAVRGARRLCALRRPAADGGGGARRDRPAAAAVAG
ncbi:ATP-binding cassette domain-containing protein [Tistrella bauzanensis]